jgi:hypothetical protein
MRLHVTWQQVPETKYIFILVPETAHSSVNWDEGMDAEYALNVIL